MESRADFQPDDEDDDASTIISSTQGAAPSNYRVRDESARSGPVLQTETPETNTSLQQMTLSCAVKHSAGELWLTNLTFPIRDNEVEARQAIAKASKLPAGLLEAYGLFHSCDPAVQNSMLQELRPDHSSSWIWMRRVGCTASQKRFIIPDEYNSYVPASRPQADAQWGTDGLETARATRASSPVGEHERPVVVTIRPPQGGVPSVVIQLGNERKSDEGPQLDGYTMRSSPTVGHSHIGPRARVGTQASRMRTQPQQSSHGSRRPVRGDDYAPHRPLERNGDYPSYEGLMGQAGFAPQSMPAAAGSADPRQPFDRTYSEGQRWSHGDDYVTDSRNPHWTDAASAGGFRPRPNQTYDHL